MSFPEHWAWGMVGVGIAILFCWWQYKGDRMGEELDERVRQLEERLKNERSQTTD